MTAERRDLAYLKEASETIDRLLNGTDYFKGLVKKVKDDMAKLQGSLETDFSMWIRETPELDSRLHGLSIHDVDWLIHQFKVAEDKNGERSLNNLMIIEEKRFGASSTFAQRDTLKVLDGLLTGRYQDSKAARFRVTNERGRKVLVRYYGLHTLQFSHSGPQDSSEIKWDDRLITTDQLTKLIRFEIHPRTLRLRDTTERRHHANKAAEAPLFDNQTI